MDRPATQNRHIPEEIVEEILSNLPVKSLLRFSSASKSWNIMINEAGFSKKYRGRERIIIQNPNSCSYKSYSLSAAVSNNPIEKTATDLDVVKFDQRICFLTIRAVCDRLCFLENQRFVSLFIWNPSNHKFYKLPLFTLPTAKRRPDAYYGLGYDTVGDDYKLLRIQNYDRSTLLYSLRSNSWRVIQSFPRRNMSQGSWFVSGALHWLCYHKMSNYHYVIVSFDLSKEEYGELAPPTPMHKLDEKDVVVLRGKLCLSINYGIESRFVLWVMEDYGVAESWTKKFDIDYDLFGLKSIDRWLRPLCTCDDDDDAICVTSISGESWVMWKNKDDGKTLVRKNFGHEDICRKRGFVYVESLLSPAALVTSHENKE